MSKKSLVAPFASLLGMGRARAEDSPVEDDERKQREGESDEDYAKRMEELDEKERDEEDAGRAEEKEREKESQRAESDDEDDEDDEKDETAKAARALERARCARIIAHGIKIGAVRQAGVFAFDTKMSSKNAIAALDAGRVDSPAPRKTGLADRMAAARTPNPGAGGAGTKLSTAQMIVLAGKKRRGEI